MADLLNPNHYYRLPICGFCQNAWDMLFQRPPWASRPGSMSPGEWVNLCPVGGCDPDVWDYLNEFTGEPNGVKPKGNNATYHRRLTDDHSAAWRKRWPGIVHQWAAKKNEKFQPVVDRYGKVLSRVVADDDIDWGDEEVEDDPGGNHQDVSDLVDPVW